MENISKSMAFDLSPSLNVFDTGVGLIGVHIVTELRLSGGHVGRAAVLRSVGLSLLGVSHTGNGLGHVGRQLDELLLLAVQLDALVQLAVQVQLVDLVQLAFQGVGLVDGLLLVVVALLLESGHVVQVADLLLLLVGQLLVLLLDDLTLVLLLLLAEELLLGVL